MSPRILPTPRMTSALVSLYLAREGGEDLSEVAKEFPGGPEQLAELSGYLDTLGLPALREKDEDLRFVEAMTHLMASRYFMPIKRRRRLRLVPPV